MRAGFWKRIGTKDGAEGAANSSPTTPTMNDVTTMPGATGVTGGVGKGRAGVGSGRAGVGAGRGGVERRWRRSSRWQNKDMDRCEGADSHLYISRVWRG